MEDAHVLWWVDSVWKDVSGMAGPMVKHGIPEFCLKLGSEWDHKLSI